MSPKFRVYPNDGALRCFPSRNRVLRRLTLEDGSQQELYLSTVDLLLIQDLQRIREEDEATQKEQSLYFIFEHLSPLMLSLVDQLVAQEIVHDNEGNTIKLGES